MWNLEYSREADRDFELIFDHLFAVYLDLGDAPEEALERGADRIRELRLAIDRLVETPYIGMLRSDIHPGIRFMRRDKAAVWFLPIEERRTIVVAAIFFGGQDHIRRMLARLLES
ncbi:MULTISPECIES: type II toxin-antitoxin system RelE/ParE family toxin [unclassified Rhizobium]|uniref:type II toxin-antitoxin system RelE/ParE family toxin n=1 Tax=unclassified Rhizobium TaxID=2613769 RepID=UPI000EAA3350|nr:MULTISPECIES: type II toxin-antitoxin system RelE/ParE family toxin [unclassified Rhizobium]AYG69140.1 type II toxin-antitoxin system RelE/ParE family toxin [Rhizobium sp. CCGE531]AYG75520.1 type II toxin-antitoxin system RelE/ParE family toxin [Rhizobium sp. CCGE532]